MLVFDSERWDTDGCHDTVTNDSRLTCKTAGKYLIVGHVAFDANANGMRGLDIQLNGATSITNGNTMNVGLVNRTQITTSTIYDLAVNDYVELMAFQTSGGSLNVASVGNHSPEFSVIRIGP